MMKGSDCLILQFYHIHMKSGSLLLYVCSVIDSLVVVCMSPPSIELLEVHVYYLCIILSYIGCIVECVVESIALQLVQLRNSQLP